MKQSALAQESMRPKRAGCRGGGLVGDRRSYPPRPARSQQTRSGDASRAHVTSRDPAPLRESAPSTSTSSTDEDIGFIGHLTGCRRPLILLTCYGGLWPSSPEAP